MAKPLFHQVQSKMQNILDQVSSVILFKTLFSDEDMKHLNAVTSFMSSVEHSLTAHSQGLSITAQGYHRHALETIVI